MSVHFTSAALVVRAQKAALVAILGIVATACQTSAGATWPAFGTYRIPYADNTQIKVWQDFITHSPDGRYDLKGQGAGPFAVVAAASGWVRVVSDQNVGGDEANNNYVWIEHPYPFCQAEGVTWPGKPAGYDDTCIQCLGEFCNEWTKYSHLQTNSATGTAGLTPGEFVQAGTLVGYEGSVGAPSQHLHWEVARLDPADLFQHVDGGEENGWPHDWSGGGWVGSPDLLPRLCGVPGYLDQNEFHTAVGCSDTANAPATGGNAVANLRWNWQGRTASATGVVKFSGPDKQNRITVSGFALDQPVSLDGTTIVVHAARLIRPVTFTLARDGSARIAADEVLLTYDLRSELASPGTRSSASGPLRGGSVNVKYFNGVLSFSFDATPLGTVVGDARRP
jgi:hypothetical protein